MQKRSAGTVLQKMGMAAGKFLSDYDRNLDWLITMTIPWTCASFGYKTNNINADH
ncbi:MAG: hypothetical protein K0B06_09465 [Brevefilum sp.]|nr:hypothetical protein [Brevefilum sp.]